MEVTRSNMRHSFWCDEAALRSSVSLGIVSAVDAPQGLHVPSQMSQGLELWSMGEFPQVQYLIFS